jgi:hypothetical protein
MREIKFRAFDKDNNKMIVPFTLDDLVDGEFIATLDNCEIMQYTGLKDKNGKEIYEGDIVRNDEAIRLSKIGMINPTLEKLGVKPPLWLTIIQDIRQLPFYEGQFNDMVEVIGNIYENPELLKNNEDENLSNCCGAEVINGRCEDCKDNCK